MAIDTIRWRKDPGNRFTSLCHNRECQKRIYDNDPYGTSQGWGYKILCYQCTKKELMKRFLVLKKWEKKKADLYNLILKWEQDPKIISELIVRELKRGEGIE